MTCWVLMTMGGRGHQKLRAQSTPRGGDDRRGFYVRIECQRLRFVTCKSSRGERALGEVTERVTRTVRKHDACHNGGYPRGRFAHPAKYAAVLRGNASFTYYLPVKGTLFAQFLGDSARGIFNYANEIENLLRHDQTRLIVSLDDLRDYNSEFRVLVDG